MSAVDYDLVIIGAGPAGLTAGIYAARARMNVLLLEKAVPGGQVLVTDWVENYPGFPEGISGYDLAEKMRVQAVELGLEIETAEVHSLNLSEETKEIVLKDITQTFKGEGFDTKVFINNIKHIIENAYPRTARNRLEESPQSAEVLEGKSSRMQQDVL